MAERHQAAGPRSHSLEAGLHPAVFPRGHLPLGRLWESMGPFPANGSCWPFMRASFWGRLGVINCSLGNAIRLARLGRRQEESGAAGFL